MKETITLSFEKITSLEGRYDYEVNSWEKLGFIYLLKNGSKIKIGASKYPVSRIKTLLPVIGISKPVIYLSNQVKFHLDIERHLHEKFKSKRVVGEWFRASFDDLINDIKPLDIIYTKVSLKSIRDSIKEAINN